MTKTPETNQIVALIDSGQAVLGDFRHLCEQLEIQRNEARGWAASWGAKCVRAEKMLRVAAGAADQWRECAEKLAEQLNWWAGPPLQIGGHHESVVALREFDRLKESSK
jgi:hypothetical protein